VGEPIRVDHYPVASGGEQQARGRSARAFIVKADCDGGMSLRAIWIPRDGRRYAGTLLLTRNSETGNGPLVVVVTHDPQVAALAHLESSCAMDGGLRDTTARRCSCDGCADGLN